MCSNWYAYIITMDGMILGAKSNPEKAFHVIKTMFNDYRLFTVNHNFDNNYKTVGYRKPVGEDYSHIYISKVKVT